MFTGKNKSDFAKKLMQPSFLIKHPDSSRTGEVQFINLKSYDEDCLLR